MAFRRKPVLLCIGLLVAGLIVCLLWSPGKPPRVHLPDGSSITLQGVSYEKRLRLRTGNDWRDYLGAILSQSLARKLDARFITFGGETNALNLWLNWDDYRTWSVPNLRCVTVDEHGCELGLDTPSFHMVTPHRQVMTVEFKEFPRRSKHFLIRFYQTGTNNDWAVAAELSVRNPAQRSAPVWKAEPLPIRQRIEKTEFSLLSAHTGVMAGRLPLEPAKPGEMGGVAVTIARAPGTTPDWEWVEVNRIMDALGQNGGRGGHVSVGMGPDRIRFVTRAGLCVEEPAWKMELQFARVSNFPSNELWNIDAVPVPRPSTNFITDITSERHGVMLHFRGILPAAAREPKAKRGVEKPAAYVVCTNLPPDLQFKLIKAVDQEGREVRQIGMSRNGDDFVFGLALDSKVKTVDLTFAMTRLVTKEYMVKPTQIPDSEFKRPR
jgi:hypothetical protein